MVAQNRGLIIGLGCFVAGLLVWLLLPQLTPMNKALLVMAATLIVGLALWLVVRQR